MTDDLEDLTSRVLAWRKTNDGSYLHAKPNNQFCVNWDHGGYHEIGCMYDTKTASTDIDLICDVFNWALEQLTPSTQGFYGDRTYEADCPRTEEDA